MLLAVLDSNAITFRTSVGLFHRLLNIDIGRLRGDCARFDVWVCVSVRVDVFACVCVFCCVSLSLCVCVRACDSSCVDVVHFRWRMEPLPEQVKALEETSFVWNLCRVCEWWKGSRGGEGGASRPQSGPKRLERLMKPLEAVSPDKIQY